MGRRQVLSPATASASIEAVRTRDPDAAPPARIALATSTEAVADASDWPGAHRTVVWPAAAGRVAPGVSTVNRTAVIPAAPTPSPPRRSWIRTLDCTASAPLAPSRLGAITMGWRGSRPVIATLAGPEAAG